MRQDEARYSKIKQDEEDEARYSKMKQDEAR